MADDSSSEEKHLLEQLAKTGFPLEVEVSDLLEPNWLVFPNEAYVDEDEGKTREIDMFAIHNSETDQLTWANPPRLFLATYLAVECKRSETHAWVFLTRNETVPPGLGSGQTLDFLQVFSGDSQSFLEQTLELPKLHYEATEKIAHAGTPIRLKNNGSEKKASKSEMRDDIFEARNQLMKFSSDFLNGYRKRFAKDPNKRDVALLFLTIVFDGPLYEAKMEGQKWSVSPSKHVLLKSGRYSKTTGNFQSFLIDVVTKQGFAEHVKLLNNDIALITNEVTFRNQELLSKADEAVKKLPGSFAFAKL